jgi:TPR repeat protein
MDNNNLDNTEKNELITIFKNKCCNSIIDNFSRKIYNLFINNIVYESEDEPTNNGGNYYLGVYYHFINVNYEFAKKHYLMAIEKGNTNAMINLGCYYDDVEKKYYLVKKYLLMAIDKGNIYAMFILGYYYENNGDMLGIDYELMKKYYLMAIEKGYECAMKRLRCYYMHVSPNNDDLQNYLFAIIKGNIRFRNVQLHDYAQLTDILLIILGKVNTIDYINLDIDDFSFCILVIINYIYTVDNKQKLVIIIDKFMKCVCKIYYSHSKKEYQKKYQKCIKQIFNSDKHNSQLFMEYLDYYYYKYLDEKYAPNGKGYNKTKKHFELTVAKTNKK